MLVAGVELVLANLLTGTQAGGFSQLCFLAINYLAATNRIFVLIRLLAYFSINFWVNLVDFGFKLSFKEGTASGYYHDEFTQTSFSYTVHQIAMCNLFAFCIAELIAPNYVRFEPALLSYTARLFIPISASMFISFLVELTWYAPELRIAVF